MLGFFSDEMASHLAAAEGFVTKALTLAPDHARAHHLLGGVYGNSYRAAEAIAECERALALDPNLGVAHGYIGAWKMFMGRGEETEDHISAALRLSPRDPEANLWLLWAGVAKLMIGADGDAAAWLRRSIETDRNYFLAHHYLAAALAHLGRLDDARKAVGIGRALDPTYTVARYRAGVRSNNPTYLAGRERIVEGMRKAGVPEG